MHRIGIGYDIHRLVKGRKLILGGVRIPHSKGLIGHSDADVLLHAVCDALLGAAGEDDIGEHFPDTDAKYRNISSLKLLEKVRGLIKSRGFSVINIDTVVIAEEPKLSHLKEKMQVNIAKVLKIEESCVNIKATTNEGVGGVGERKAIASYAVALLNKHKER